MSSFQFGEPHKLLYGVYHAPQLVDSSGAEVTTQKAVLLCPPIAQEYLRTHWIYRQISQKLTHEGYHVLRFDYSCMGDSYGETQKAMLSVWVEDVHRAARELIDISGTTQLTVVGLRMGATLALLAQAQAQILGARKIILWDPVVDGDLYLDELKTLTREMSGTRPVRPKADGMLLGFHFSNKLRESIGAIKLESVVPQLLKSADSPRLILIQSEMRPEYQVLQKLGLSSVYTDDAGRWDALCEAHDSFLSHENVQAIVRAVKS